MGLRLHKASRPEGCVFRAALVNLVAADQTAYLVPPSSPLQPFANAVPDHICRDGDQKGAHGTHGFTSSLLEERQQREYTMNEAI